MIPYEGVLEIAFQLLLAVGLALILVGACMALRDLRAASSEDDTPHFGSTTFTASRRVFLAGWLLIGGAFSLGAAYLAYYFPD